MQPRITHVTFGKGLAVRRKEVFELMETPKPLIRFLGLSGELAGKTFEGEGKCILPLSSGTVTAYLNHKGIWTDEPTAVCVEL